MRPGRLIRALLPALLTLGVALLAAAAPASASTDTIFGSQTPAEADSGDTNSVVVGVKFSSETAGRVTGVRFYKAATNTGTHIGTLWSSTGTQLATVTFSGESSAGWQQASFSKAVEITPGTTYLATYFAPNGHYSDTAKGLSSGAGSPPLKAIANTASADGVYAYSAGNTFPTSTFEATNYWVDVMFEPSVATAPGQVTGVTATAGPGSANVSWKAPTAGGAPTTYTVTPYIGSTAQTATVISGTPPLTTTPVTGLANGTSYTFTVQAANEAGPGAVSEHSGAVTPSGSIAYPDLTVLMPTSEISIHHSGATRTLEFTHISEDSGEGPLDIRPVYNAATGISQGYQGLYQETSPGVWKFAYTVPIVGPMLWDAPTDYNFPLDRFWLYNAAAGGGLGALAATSPKVDFCMTSDTRVGNVPNTPETNEYSGAECNSPEGRLGLSVGWGDQYDATDEGEGIDISNLPNGTYWLRGAIDPYHYFTESNTADNFTDTKLKIEGNSVTVLEQTHPDSTPPTVALTAPSSGSSISGTATLSATASGPAAISSVQFLLDGQPIGSPVTSPPYTLKWKVGSTTSGQHYLSAQALDANGDYGTAADVPVNVQEGSKEEGPDTEPPSVSIVNPAAGKTVSNTIQVTAAAHDNVAVKSVRFYLDGKALGEPVTKAPYAISWNTASASNGPHTLTAEALDTSNNAATSSPVEVKVQNPAEEGACFVMDVNTTVSGQRTVKTQRFTTAEAGEELLAFVSMDGPAGAGLQHATVSGAGLQWSLVARSNSQTGDAEIWAARATKQLKNKNVKSKAAVNGYDQTLTVVSIQQSNGIGSSATAGGASGEPSVTLATKAAGSLVYAVGEDPTSATSRAIGSNQVLLRQSLDSAAQNTFWSQYADTVTGPAGEVVTLDDPSPTTDAWNMASVEILAGG